MESTTEEPYGSVALITSHGRSRLVLTGEIDLGVKTQVQPAVDEALGRNLPIDVDARELRFMDSFGIATLAVLVRRSPHRVRLIQPPELVRFLLDVTRLDSLVDVLDEDPGPNEAHPAGHTTDV
ncbi:STAS domain-containing protein [Georgenia faecalis]|uniref:STAS domain-containing protein n=1 Tax=Georgenia faecalis TaxID=2483799 RepID=A0ABV9D6H2_9MICO|nr:STAS domain-containing protein [Georgenia faecalis]